MPEIKLLDYCWALRCKTGNFTANEDGLTLTKYVYVSEDEQGSRIDSHSPWISRLLQDLGHEVIVAHARKVESITASARRMIAMTPKQEAIRINSPSPQVCELAQIGTTYAFQPPSQTSTPLLMPSSTYPSPRVLCVACSSDVFSRLDRALNYSKFHVLSAATRDKGVAVCVAEAIAVAVLDGESIRGEEVSLATALKMVRPTMPIILLEERERQSNIPEGIDAVVPVGDPAELLRKIKELLSGAGEARAAG